MKNLRMAVVIATFFAMLAVTAAIAQTESFTLKINRDWGYGGFNGDIQGLFSLRVTGPSDLVRVEYFIDNKKIGEVSQSPFNLQFSTDNYPLGVHTIFAIGYSSKGQDFQSNILTSNFVPKQSSTKIVLPLLGVVLAAILFSTLAPLVSNRGRHLRIPLGAERNYGAGGGGICPNCHRPFTLPLVAAHFGTFRLAPCPFCGKWNFVRNESIIKLREAEKTELELGQPEQPSGNPEVEELRKDIEDSKYQRL